MSGRTSAPVKREGPAVRIAARCMDCRHCVTESYEVQGDSGSDVYCIATGSRRLIGDTTWDTPDWCPFLERAKQELVSLVDPKAEEIERRAFWTEHAEGLEKEAARMTAAHPRLCWHEDDGPALWWTAEAGGVPYAGTPLDDDFPDDVTHWTRIPNPVFPEVQS